MPRPIRIGALVSSKGNKLQAIIDQCRAGHVHGKVVFVCSDNPDAYALRRARQHNVPCFIVDYATIRQRYRRQPECFELPPDCKFDDLMTKQKLYSLVDETPEELKFRLETRVIAEAQMLREMERYPFDLLILAGFIRKLTPYFIEKINEGSAIPRIMNLHATLCPAFPGIDGYGQTLRHGCKLGGCTVHFVDFGVDSGPIIDQAAFKIEPGDTVASVKRKGLQLECTLYPKCIQLFAEKRLSLERTETGRILVNILPGRKHRKAKSRTGSGALYSP
jgi:phosphoribosylglycinamide formyltransferase-1